LKPPKQKAFLTAYSQVGNITEAARIVKCSRASHYEWLAEDPEYAEAFEQAQEKAVDLLEAEARRRAVDGLEEPVIYQGELSFLPKVRRGQVVTDASGRQVRSDKPLTIRKYSDTLLIFLLKGARPAKYAKFEGEIKHTHVGSSRLDLSRLSDDELTYLRDLAARLSQSGGDRSGAGEADAEEDGPVLSGSGPAAEGAVQEEPGVLQGREESRGEMHPGGEPLRED
jgi:hypothetical protein